MKKITLKNNLDIYVEKSDKFKTWSASVYIYRPLNKTEASYNALLVKVLKTSCKKYPSRKLLSKQLDKLYGTALAAGVRKYADTHTLIFSVKSVCDCYLPETVTSPVVSLLKNVITEPNLIGNGFDPDVVELEKINLIKQIEAYINDKAYYADKRCLEILCEDDDYATGVNGDIEVIKTITPESLYKHYLEVINNSKVDVFVCGNADVETIKPFFEDINTTEKPLRSVPFSTIRECIETEEIMDVTQGKLVLGFTTDVTDNSKRCAVMMFNAVFGGCPTSKLFNNVREKLSLAYYANSRIAVSKGIMFARSGIEIEKFSQVKNEILNQLEDMCSGNISADEVENARAHLVNIYSSLEDDPESTVSLKSGWLTEGEHRTVEEIIAGIKNVTLTEIVDVAKSYKLSAVYFLKGEQA